MVFMNICRRLVKCSENTDLVQKLLSLLCKWQNQSSSQFLLEPVQRNTKHKAFSEFLSTLFMLLNHYNDLVFLPFQKISWSAFRS